MALLYILYSLYLLCTNGPSSCYSVNFSFIDITRYYILKTVCFEILSVCFYILISIPIADFCYGSRCIHSRRCFADETVCFFK